MIDPELHFEPQLSSTPSSVPINRFQKLQVEGALRLRPPFQRNLVWNDEQQSFLVDSVLRGLPVPEIYVQTITSPDGDEVWTVVDGQQRITACLRFLSGALRLVSDEDLAIGWRNRTFDEIDEDLQQRFRTFKLIVRDLPSTDEPVLREVFRRLNKTNEALKAQELRHAAYTGPFLQFVELAARAPVLQALGVFTPRDYLRRASDELMSEIALAMVHGVFPNKKDGLDQLYVTYERQGVPPGIIENLEHRFGRVFSQLDRLIPGLRATRFRNKSDFYSLFIALAKEAERLPLTEDDSSILLNRLKELSDLVGQIKREDADSPTMQRLMMDPLSAGAAKYLRAVERAASDRQNRVRRDQVLVDLIAPTTSRGELTPLSGADSAWSVEIRQLEATLDEDTEAIEEEGESRQAAEEALL